MLHGNYSVLHKYPGRFSAGLTVSDNRAAFGKSGHVRAFLLTVPRSALPNGCTPPFSWGIAQKSGGLSCKTGATGSSSISFGNLAGGLGAEAALTGFGDITLADIQQVISALAALSGVGGVAATLSGVIGLVSDLAGSGAITADFAGIIRAAAAVAGSGSIAGTARADATISADINVTGDLLTTSNVAESIWNALAISFNQSGTMGEAVLNAGASGNPWDTAIDGTYTAAEVMRIVAAALAGKATGGGTSTITLRNLSDTADAVAMTVDVNGNRSAVTITP